MRISLGVHRLSARTGTLWRYCGIPPPAFLPYDVANGLTRLVAGGLFPLERTSQAWQTVLSLPITYRLLRSGGDRGVEVARDMRRQSAYDAAYILQTHQAGAALWPFDRPLARNVAGRDFPVKLMR